MRKTTLFGGVILLTTLVLVACGSKGDVDATQQNATQTPAQSVQVETPGSADEQPAVDERVYRYSQLLSRDAIRPIYDPEFVPAAQAELDDDELVLAIAIGDEAKAYPIRVLNSREMVNDELAGIPILATW